MQKMKEIELKEIISGNCYHISTNGHECPTMMRDHHDYITAHNYLAISAWKTKVEIVAYSIMSNHVHALVICSNREIAVTFIRLFKLLLSHHLRNRYGMKKTLHSIKDSIILIDSISYIRNCIVYILRNALCAKICVRVEDYPWSSYGCYFNKTHVESKPITSLGVREKRRILKTRAILSNCPFCIDQKGKIVDESFIRHDIVEKIFRNSGRMFLFSLGNCNDARMEFEMACKPLMNVSDNDLLFVAEELASKKFNGKSIAELSINNKCSMIKTLFFNNKTSIPQLSRVLGIPRHLTSTILSS